MNNLIRNELTKIFHKKALYIVFVITIAVIILNAVLTKIFENEMDDYMYNDNYISYLEEDIKNLDKNKTDEKEMYYSELAELKTIELGKKYENGSWQRYIVNQNAQSIIYNMLVTEGKPEYDEAKKEYDKLVERLNSGDWKVFAKEELEDVNAQIKLLEEEKKNEANSATENIPQEEDGIDDIQDEEELYINPFAGYSLEELKDRKQALEWRLEKNISYGTSNMNSILEKWIYSKQELRQYEEQAKTKPLKYEEKYQKQQSEEMLKLSEYAIINNIADNISLNNFSNRYNLASTADSEIIDSTSSYLLFITIAIVIIAGTMISEEFNKGTIKLLLVRPHKRLKILFAKFIACFIVLAISYIVILLSTCIINGFAYGFNDYTNSVMIYNFNTNAVESIGTFKYMLLVGVSILPEFILLMTLAFTLSVLFVNSPIAIALPLLGLMGSDIINQFALYYEKAKFLRFFVTPNWDLRMFLFGKLPEFEPISLPFSITICLIYFVIMVVVSMVVFNKKEIKNI